jgi:hypothetical protein
MDLEVYVANLQENTAEFENDVVSQTKTQMLVEGGTFDSEREERNHQYKTTILNWVRDQSSTSVVFQAT